MIPVKTPSLIKHYLGGYVWEKPNTQNKIYLTFDDGPIPEVTPWVLDLLNHYNVKATFFCVGENISKYPEIFRSIINDGHSVGNHTYNHLKGWNSKTDVYLQNIEKANSEIEYLGHSTKLFRPPYGKLKSTQQKAIKEKGYDIIMWSILSKDYEENIGYQQVYNNLTKFTKIGDILVCHDNKKAFDKLKKALPKAIDYLLEKGFVFAKI